jgi:hypothetical protein
MAHVFSIWHSLAFQRSNPITRRAIFEVEGYIWEELTCCITLATQILIEQTNPKTCLYLYKVLRIPIVSL